MDPKLIWAAVAIVALIIVVAAWAVSQRLRRDRLKKRFGPEYERVVARTRSPRKAEAMLQARARRVAGLHIRPLAPGDAERFAGQWRELQRRFVDTPDAAVSQADALVSDVLRARGYPVGDFEQRTEDISVDHPHAVSHYRSARDLARRHARGEANTEDLRQALVHYRALFDELLDLKSSEPTEAVHEVREFARGHR
jgi:hypothetical protein